MHHLHLLSVCYQAQGQVQVVKVNKSLGLSLDFKGKLMQIGLHEGLSEKQRPAFSNQRHKR